MCITDPNYVTVHISDPNYVTAHISDLNYVIVCISDPNYVITHIFDPNYVTAHISSPNYVIVHISDPHLVTEHISDSNIVTAHLSNPNYGIAKYPTQILSLHIYAIQITSLRINLENIKWGFWHKRARFLPHRDDNFVIHCKFEIPISNIMCTSANLHNPLSPQAVDYAN